MSHKAIIFSGDYETVQGEGIVGDEESFSINICTKRIDSNFLFLELVQRSSGYQISKSDNYHRCLNQLLDIFDCLESETKWIISIEFLARWNIKYAKKELIDQKAFSV